MFSFDLIYVLAKWIRLLSIISKWLIYVVQCQKLQGKIWELWFQNGTLAPLLISRSLKLSYAFSNCNLWRLLTHKLWLIVETDVLQAGEENQSMLYHTVAAMATHLSYCWSWWMVNCDCNVSISFIKFVWLSGISPSGYLCWIEKKGNQILIIKFLIIALYTSC